MRNGICLMALLVFFSVGCSTIFNGTRQNVSINSNIPGANVIVDGKVIGQTPFAGEIARTKKMKIVLEKEGYEKKEITPNRKIPSAFWGNILLGGVIGSTTDSISGATTEYAPNSFYVNLKKNQQQ